MNFFDPKAVDWWWENGVMKVASIGAIHAAAGCNGTGQPAEGNAHTHAAL